MRGFLNFLNFLYFDKLITPDVIRAIFIINMLAITIYTLLAPPILFSNFFGSIVTFFLLFLANRIACEYLIVQFKISEDLSRIVKKQEAK